MFLLQRIGNVVEEQNARLGAGLRPPPLPSKDSRSYTPAEPLLGTSFSHKDHKERHFPKWNAHMLLVEKPEKLKEGIKLFDTGNLQPDEEVIGMVLPRPWPDVARDV